MEVELPQAVLDLAREEQESKQAVEQLEVAGAERERERERIRRRDFGFGPWREENV